jgi:hypothetical protein
MPNATTSAWTDELVSTLGRLFADGCSQSQIANAIGIQHGVRVSRNAIGGKLVRLGLMRPQSEPKSKPQAAPRARRPKAARIAGLVAPTMERRDGKAPVREYTPLTIDTVVPRHLPFARINRSTCKYECSEQDDPARFTFCGHKPAPGKPSSRSSAR